MTFQESRNFVTFHDQVALLSKWSHDKIFVGALSGDLLEVTNNNHNQLKYYVSKSIHTHSLAVTSLSVSADGTKIASSSLDGTCILSSRDLTEIREIDCPNAIAPRCAIRRDGNIIVVVGKDCAYIDNGDSSTKVPIPNEFFRDVQFIGDSEGIAMALARHSLVQIDIESGQVVNQLYGNSNTSSVLRRPLHCLAANPHSKLVAVGTYNGHVELYDYTSNERVGEVNVGGCLVESLDYSSDGQFLAVAQSNRCVSLIDLNAHPAAVCSKIEPHRSRAISVAFNHDGTQLVCIGEDKTVVIENIRYS